MQKIPESGFPLSGEDRKMDSIFDLCRRKAAGYYPRGQKTTAAGFPQGGGNGYADMAFMDSGLPGKIQIEGSAHAAAALTARNIPGQPYRKKAD